MIGKILIQEGMMAKMNNQENKILLNELDEPIGCHYHYGGCTLDATGYYQNHHPDCIEPGAMFPKSYPACDNCLEAREKAQELINERYLDITPFTGQNEDGEYYDEDSY